MDPITTRNRLSTSLIIALLLLLVILAGALTFNLRKSNELLQRTIQQNNIQEQWRNQLGQQITTASFNYLTEQELRKSQDSTIVDLRNRLDLSNRKLDQVLFLYSTVSQHLASSVRDTVVLVAGEPQQARTFTYSDEWMPRMRGIVGLDSAWLDYSLKMDWQLTQTWKKRGLFNLGTSRELDVQLLSLNPHVTVNRIQQFKILQPQPALPEWAQKLTLFGLGALTGSLLVGR